MRVAPSSARAAFADTGREEHAVPRLRADVRGQAVTLGVGEILGDRAAQRAVLGDQHIGQALVAALLGELLPAVQRAARLRRPARHDDRADVRRLEHPERGVGEVVGALDEFDAEPQVGLVGTEPAHRVGVADPRQRQRQVVADQRPQRLQDLLGDRDDVVGVDEAHLHVQLGELRLAVGAEILVAVAAGDLVVALHACDHQQLLEQLRALRQRVERARLQAGGHQEVAGALRRRARQRRRLDLDEVVRGQHTRGRRHSPWSATGLRSPGPRGADPGSGTSGGLPRRRSRRAGTAAARTPPAPSASSR